MGALALAFVLRPKDAEEISEKAMDWQLQTMR